MDDKLKMHKDFDKAVKIMKSVIDYHANIFFPSPPESIPFDMRCIEEPREIIRELLEALTDTINLFGSSDIDRMLRTEEVGKRNHVIITKAEAYLKEITGSPLPSEPVIIKNQEDSTND